MELVIWRAEVAAVQGPARAAPSAAAMGQEAAKAE
jgi:hypothetical protein